MASTRTVLRTPMRKCLQRILGGYHTFANGTFSPLDIPSCRLLFDAADLTTLFTDVAATTNVTTSGQAVAAWRDKTANATLFTEGTLANRPLWTSAALPYLDFNAAVPHRLSATVDLSTNNALTVVAGLTRDTAADMSVLNHNGTTTPYFNMEVSSSHNMGLTSVGNGTARTVNVATGTPPQTYVVSGMARIHTTSLVNVHVNNIEGTPSTLSQGTGNYANATMRIGQRVSNIRAWDGRYYALAFFTEVLSTENLALVKAWVAAKSGVTL